MFNNYKEQIKELEKTARDLKSQVETLNNNHSVQHYQIKKILAEVPTGSKLDRLLQSIESDSKLPNNVTKIENQIFDYLKINKDADITFEDTSGQTILTIGGMMIPSPWLFTDGSSKTLKNLEAKIRLLRDLIKNHPEQYEKALKTIK